MTGQALLGVAPPELLGAAPPELGGGLTDDKIIDELRYPCHRFNSFSGIGEMV